MHNESWVSGEPVTDLWGLVGRGVIQDEVNVEVCWNFAVDGVQELLELDRARWRECSEPMIWPVVMSSAA